MQRTPTYGQNISYVGIRWRYTLWCEHPLRNAESNVCINAEYGKNTGTESPILNSTGCGAPHHAEYVPHHIMRNIFHILNLPCGILHHAENSLLFFRKMRKIFSNTPHQCGIPHSNSASCGVLEQIFRTLRRSLRCLSARCG